MSSDRVEMSSDQVGMSSDGVGMSSDKMRMSSDEVEIRVGLIKKLVNRFNAKCYNPELV
ncbi:MAG: hypothetical protein ACLFUC_02395 [Bacteroidales bacterium]